MKTHKILSAILALALVVGLLPTLSIGAKAADITSALDFMSGPDATAYASEKDGVQWDAATKTLTLNGMTLKVTKSDSYTVALRVPDGTTIVVAEGTENSIEAESTYNGGEYPTAAIEAFGAVTIKGTGTLSLQAKAEVDPRGIRSEGDLTVQDTNLKVTMITEGTAAKSVQGILSEGKITIQDAAVDVSFPNAARDGYMFCYMDDANHSFNGIFTWDKEVTIVGENADVQVHGGGIGILAGQNSVSTGSLSIDGGKVTVDSGTHGLWAKNSMVIRSCVVNATAHGNSNNKAKAIYSQGTILLDDRAVVTAICDDTVEPTTKAYYAVRAKGDITIQNGAVLDGNGQTAMFNVDEGKKVTIKGENVLADGVLLTADENGDIVLDVTKNYKEISVAEIAQKIIIRLDKVAEEKLAVAELSILGKTLNGISVEKTEKGYLLKSGESYLKLNAYNRQLENAETAEAATIWKYNGGLYTEIASGCGFNRGFFRAPRFVRYYLAVSAYGEAYARLMFAPVMANYADVATESVSLDCTDSTSYIGLLKKHTYTFTIHAAEGAKVSYDAGLAKGWGTTFTMQYKPAYVNITVVDGEVTTVWQAKLTRTGYEMSIIG